MASIRKHKRSPYWFLRRRDLDSGKWVEKSTGLRTDDAAQTRKAQRMADKATVDESRVGVRADSPAFAVWVPGYLVTHYDQQSPETKRRMTTAWQALRLFLNWRGIVYPRQVKYADAQEYLRWRNEEAVHGRFVGHNTALLELKFLSQLMTEAIRREFCEANPLTHLGVARAPQKAKPELSDEDIAKLRKGLVNQPDWMRIAVEIALYTGCRFNECAIEMRNIDLEKKVMRMRDSKRKETDPKKYFTVPIHPSLIPLFTSLKASGAERTCEISREKNWRINRLFKHCDVNATFHSLRVTFVTRCHRGGLSESEAMRLVNHSSKLVHAVYSRLNAEDARAAQARIPLPSLAQ